MFSDICLADFFSKSDGTDSCGIYVGNSTTSLPFKEPAPLGFSQTTEVVSIDPQTSEPLLIAPPTFRPNSLFFGMENELQELDRRLFNAKKRAIGTACVLLWGPPGGGKSHLAREYVFTHRNAFPGGIFWIDARLPGDRFQGFWEVAQGAAMNGIQNPHQNKESAASFVEAVRNWFRARQEWLLVFDGVTFDRDEDVTQFQKFIPDSKNSSIIYTSVDRTLVRKQRLLYPIAVKVRPLQEQDAMELLYRGLGIKHPTPEQEEKSRALVRHLECLPLAIHAMGHRLSATRKAIEKYHIESYSTDSKLAQPYMGIMADLWRYNHLEALNLIHILCFFGHNVPVAMLNLGRQTLKEAKIYIKSSDGGSKRDVDNTLGTLIKYGLIDRALIRYDVIDRSTPDLSDERQGSQDSLISTLETIDIIKLHTVVQGFCCDSLKGEGRFLYWLEVAVKVFCQSFEKADAQIKKQSMPGLVKDYREYETHGQRLLSHLVEKLAKTSALRETRVKLQRTLLKIKKEIENRSPGSSQESFRPQASIFDRTTSTSDDAPDTPKSTPSRVSTLGLGLEKPPVDSPVSMDGHHDQVRFPSEKPESPQMPEYPEDPGYTADREEFQAPYPLTPTRSEDTARPYNSATHNHGSEWQLVSNTKKLSKSRLSRNGKSGVGSIKRPRAGRDLGSFHPTAWTGITTTPVMGSISRVRAESRGWTLASSEAVTSLRHHASPPRSRGARDMSSGRSSSRPPVSQTQSKSSNQPASRGQSPERVPLSHGSPNNESSTPNRSSPTLEDMQRGRSRDVLRSRQGNIQPSPLAAEFVPQSRVTQSATNEVDPYRPPPAVASKYQTPVSSPGFNYSYPHHSSDPNLSNMPPVFTYNENDNASRPLPPISTRPPPLPYETGITITAKRRLPPDFRGHHRPGTYQQYPSPATPRYLPQIPYPQNPPVYFSAPLPHGYSSQPMSRNPSGQSNPYAATEPPLYPPSLSPHLSSTAMPVSPRDRLPDGCSPRKSPKFGNAFPAYRDDDIFEHPSITRNDPRFSTDHAIAGMGTWASPSAPEPISPLSPNTAANAHDLPMSMSRSTSGPGIALAGNQGLGIAPFGFAFGSSGNGQLRFGQLEPIDLDEARQRTVEHGRRLMADFEQGAFRPPLQQRRSGMAGRGEYGAVGGLHYDNGRAGTGAGGGGGGGEVAPAALQQPYPDINLIPTPSDEMALREFVEFEGRRRGLSAPGYREDLVGLRGLGVEFDG